MKSEPLSVVQAMFACINARDIDGIGRLLTDDAEFDVPYAPETGSVKGKKEVLSMFAGMSFSLFEPFTLTVTQGYPMQEKDLVLVEYRSRGLMRYNKRPYNNIYAGIFRAREGRLAFWREYFNPVVLAQAAGDDIDAIMAEATRAAAQFR